MRLAREPCDVDEGEASRLEVPPDGVFSGFLSSYHIRRRPSSSCAPLPCIFSASPGLRLQPMLPFPRSCALRAGPFIHPHQSRRRQAAPPLRWPFRRIRTLFRLKAMRSSSSSRGCSIAACTSSNLDALRLARVDGRTYTLVDGLTPLIQKSRCKPLKGMGSSSSQVISVTVHQSREVPPQPDAGHLP